MAFLIKNGVIINDERELVGVNTAGITTALYVGENIQLDAASGVITATKYEGSGADLTDIVANVIVSDGIPTGISTAEGDLYYDSTDLTLFTYYDNNWVDAAPVPPGATELEITNAAGISTVQIDLLTEALKLDGTANEVSVSLNPAGDSITFGLESEVAIAGSMTAATFYGNGSGLTNLQFSSGQFIDIAGVQAGVLTATTQFIASGPGVGLTVAQNAFFGGTILAGNIEALGVLRSNVVEATVGTAVSFADNIQPFTDGAYDLGSTTNQWRDAFISGDVSVGQSVTASSFYGDGSNLIGIGLNTTSFYEVGGIQAGVITATDTLDVTNNVEIGGSLTLDGVANLNGGANLGNAATDLIGFNGRVITDVIPLLNDAVDLGSDTNQWKDIYLSGNVSAGSSVTATEFYGDGSNLTGVLSTDGGGDADLSGKLTVEELSVTAAGIALTVTDSVSAGGSITANAYYGDGSNLTGVLSTDGGGDAVLSGHLQVVSLEATGAGVALTVTNDASVGGNLVMTGEIHGPAELIIDPAGIGDNTGAVRIKGDLYVDGTEFTVNSTTVNIADKNIGLATETSTDLLLDGAGFTIGEPGSGIEQTFQYNNTASTFESSVGLGVTAGGSFKAGADEVLNLTTLGATVLNSSLTSVGSLTELDVTGKVSSGSSITAVDFYGDGSKLENIISTDGGGNADLGGKLTVDQLSVTGAGVALTVTDSVSVGGSVTAANYFGNGSALTNVLNQPDYYFGSLTRPEGAFRPTANVNNIALDGNGHMYITGSLQYLNGESALTLSKFTIFGELLWNRDIEERGVSEGYDSLVVDQDGNIIVGGFSRSDTSAGSSAVDHANIFKYSPDGEIIWQKTSFDGRINSVTVTSTNDYIVAGYLNNGDSQLQKIDSNGAVLWARDIATGDFNVLTSVVVDSNDNIFTTGYFDGEPVLLKFNSAGTIQFQETFISPNQTSFSGGYELCVDDSDNVYMASWTRNDGNDRQAVTSRFNPSTGAVVWQQAYSHNNAVAGNIEFFGITYDAVNDAVILGGDSAVELGAVLSSYDAATGSLNWKRIITASDNAVNLARPTRINGIVSDATGLYFIGLRGDGKTDGTITREIFGWFGKLPLDGSLEGTYDFLTYATPGPLFANVAGNSVVAATSLPVTTSTPTVEDLLYVPNGGTTSSVINYLYEQQQSLAAAVVGAGTVFATEASFSNLTSINDFNVGGSIIGGGAGGAQPGGTSNISGINSVTAVSYYGDGSNLTGLSVGAATSVTSFDDQTATDYPMPFLSAVGAGASIFTDSTTNEEFTYNPSTGILKVKEFDALSDARLKTEITGIEDALDKVASLRGVEYDWKNGSGSSVGVIAQEVQQVYPQLVNDSGERLTVNYNGLIGLLISAVNEMAVELAELKAQK